MRCVLRDQPLILLVVGGDPGNALRGDASTSEVNPMLRCLIQFGGEGLTAFSQAGGPEFHPTSILF